MDKPKFVYHGSCKGIPDGHLTPRPQSGDANGAFPEGSRKLVFATDDKQWGVVHTLKTSQMISTLSNGDSPIGLFIDHESWKDELSKSACALYKLPSEKFENVISKYNGLPTKEWVATSSVSAAEVIIHTPESVMTEGVQLMFLHKQIDRPLWDIFSNKIAEKEGELIAGNVSGANMINALQAEGLIDSHLNVDKNIKPVAIPASPNIGIIREDIDWLKQQVRAKEQMPVYADNGIKYRNNWTTEGKNQKGHTAEIGLNKTE